MSPDLNRSSPEEVTRLSSRLKHIYRNGAWQTSKNLSSSFNYAKKGLFYSFLSQRNFRIHLLLGAITLTLSIWLRLSLTHIAILILTITSVLVLELINTSIEAVVDLSIGPRFHPLAAIAKDCAAGAVLIAAVSSVLVAACILLPALLIHFGI